MVGEGRAQLLMAQVVELHLLKLVVVEELVMVASMMVMMVTMMVLAFGAQINRKVTGSRHVGACSSLIGFVARFELTLLPTNGALQLNLIHKYII
jgi:hypothetical protein